MARWRGRRRGTIGVRLSIGSGRRVLLNGHAKFVEGASVLRVFGGDAFLDGLRALELRAGIEEAALLTTVQFELTLGACAFGIEARGKDSAAIGATGASDRANHPRSARAELIRAPRAASGWLAVVRLISFFLLFRVAIPAVSILSIHKRLRPPVSTDCHSYNSCFCADALANLASIQSDCYTRPDGALIP
jgi:hypothetical protein